MIVTRAPLKRFVDPARPITYGIVQAGEHVEDGVPYIRPIDMDGNNGVPDPSRLLRTAPEIAQAYSRSTVREGDLIVSIGPSYGKVMIVPNELDGANLTQGTARVAPAAGVEADYLFWALQTDEVRAYWDASVGGATFRALNLEPLSRTPIPFLDSVAQRRVVRFLRSETGRVDDLARMLAEQMELLRERRQALITSAISNEQSVRGG